MEEMREAPRRPLARCRGMPAHQRSSDGQSERELLAKLAKHHQTLAVEFDRVIVERTQQLGTDILAAG
jgi:hypothetical protein